MAVVSSGNVSMDEEENLLVTESNTKLDRDDRLSEVSNGRGMIKKPVDTSSAKPNMWYLILYTLTLGISSWQYGFVMAAPAPVSAALRY